MKYLDFYFSRDRTREKAEQPKLAAAASERILLILVHRDVGKIQTEPTFLGERRLSEVDCESLMLFESMTSRQQLSAGAVSWAAHTRFPAYSKCIALPRATQ